MPGQPGLKQRLFAEALGTCLLSVVVIGSGIMGDRLSDGNVAIALLANSTATVFGLYFLIVMFGPVSGAHFNPAVTATMTVLGELPTFHALPYMIAQCVGGTVGTWLTHYEFEAEIFQWSTHERTGYHQWASEILATAGLLLVILRSPSSKVPQMVAGYIGAAYWFTASTSFANPAIAVCRMFTDTFAGIAPSSVPGYIIAEFIGAAVGVLLHRALGEKPSPTLPTDHVEMDAIFLDAIDDAVDRAVQEVWTNDGETAGPTIEDDSELSLGVQQSDSNSSSSSNQRGVCYVARPRRKTASASRV
jgi:glycerol uptake facilitator-like aquaporin